MQIIECDDNTCKFNCDGYCENAFPVIRVGQDNHSNTVNICTTYEDKRDVSV